MELKKPIQDRLARSNPGNLHVLRIAPLDPQTGPLVGLSHERIWNSFFARMLVSLLAVALPFFIIAGLVPNMLAPWGVGPEILATFLLIAITGVVARLMIRPTLALSRAAALAESGDLSVRVIPGGSGEMRHLGQSFNAAAETVGLAIELTVQRSRAVAAAAEEVASVAAARTELDEVSN